MEGHVPFVFPLCQPVQVSADWSKQVVVTSVNSQPIASRPFTISLMWYIFMSRLGPRMSLGEHWNLHWLGQRSPLPELWTGFFHSGMFISSGWSFLWCCCGSTCVEDYRRFCQMPWINPTARHLAVYSHFPGFRWCHLWILAAVFDRNDTCGSHIVGDRICWCLCCDAWCDWWWYVPWVYYIFM